MPEKTDHRAEAEGRSRSELVEALRDKADWLGARGVLDSTRDLLTEAADLLDSLEEMGVQYRAAGKDYEGADYASVPLDHDSARRVAERLNLDLQRRTVFTSPWTDIEEASK